MNVAIVGARDPSETSIWLVANFVATLPLGTLVVSGGAHGIDKIAELLWRYDWEQPFVRYCPDYLKYSHKVAPLMRNELIANACDELHAWPSETSRGTWHVAKFAAKLGKPSFIHEENGNVDQL